MVDIENPAWRWNHTFEFYESKRVGLKPLSRQRRKKPALQRKFSSRRGADLVEHFPAESKHAGPMSPKRSSRMMRRAASKAFAASTMHQQAPVAFAR